MRRPPPGSVRDSARKQEGRELKIGKRTRLDHYSVAELVVKAAKIARSKRNKIAEAKDLAWIVIASDKHKLITYIASETRDDDE